jgi:hypothetical protein
MDKLHFACGILHEKQSSLVHLNTKSYTHIVTTTIFYLSNISLYEFLFSAQSGVWFIIIQWYRIITQFTLIENIPSSINKVIHFYMLNRVSEPSASISVTVRLLIQIRRASLMGFRRDTSAIGAVEYDFMHRVWEFPNPNIPVDVCKQEKFIHKCSS